MKKQSKQHTFIAVLAGFAVIAVLINTVLPAQAWDGRWTNGASLDWPAKDPGSSDGKANSKDPLKRDYFIPAERDFADVDPEELAELDKSGYSPYVLVRFQHDVVVNGRNLPKGYYQIKIGQFSDGSPNVNLSGPPVGSRVDYRDHWWEFRKPKAPKEMFVIKKLGKVVAVIPIYKVEPYVKDKKEKLPKEAIGWVEGLGQSQPQLKIYHKKMVYIADLQWS